MNVPKTPDYKLIGAARALANDALTADSVDLNVLPAVLHELADRLAELTQPQPIETAPLMHYVKCFGGMIVDESGEILCPNNNIGVVVSTIDQTRGSWSLFMSSLDLINPTHWLPCVQVDLSALEGNGDGQ